MFLPLPYSSARTVGAGAAIHDATSYREQLEKHTKDLFSIFHVFCTRKDIHALDVVLEDTDIAKALNEYVSSAAIENLVLGASKHGFLKRLKVMDVPTTVTKRAPDFCTVYVISKSKISTVRNASRPAPFISPLYSQIHQKNEQLQHTNTNNKIKAANVCKPKSFSPKTRHRHTPTFNDKLGAFDKSQRISFTYNNEMEPSFRSPLEKGRGTNGRGDLSESDTDISFVSSGRPSTDRSPMFCDGMESGRTSRLSTSSESSYGSSDRFGSKASDTSSFTDISSTTCLDNDDAEMRRLKQELQKMMDLYSTACKEALTAKQKATELQLWRIEEEKKLEEDEISDDMSHGKAKSWTSTEGTTDSMKRRSDDETRIEEENESFRIGLRYRRYTIDEIDEATEHFSESRKIGEGGYGPVFKCLLDHTPVAVKVLRPDAAQGRSQFLKEIEVLSCLRHPNMVMLLGACPEYGCLVYDYMSNGSLEERLMKRGDKPALSWQVRFRIAAEVATGLMFLHQTKPEPVVHRDLKPANILLDEYYVSKIGDVGLARLVPAAAADDVTQLRMTSAAGTFCYIDPEYQQTGMLGVKSDVYSFGIVLLQLLTAKPAMGIAHRVSDAVEKGKFEDVLDPVVTNWPVEEALTMAKIGMQCSQLRRKDRPDLGKQVLPELLRLKELADQSIGQFMVVGGS
ncbi:unnamed protein product [Cuscuta campestris]|uniref:RING-type E3 ubiquitin transferase n=1 Tax=Cuscuta campestris TaxID=132261 RepID=A0A484KIS1_9ASTE|nr:unnamed protein product [Cuscuta campestris]